MVWPLIGAAVAGGLATGFVTTDSEDRLKGATEGVMEGLGTGLVSGVSGLSQAIKSEFNENGAGMVAGLTMIALGVTAYHLITSILSK